MPACEKDETIAVIALGSNLGNPQEQLARTVQALRETAGLRILKVSSLYLTAPVGYDDQPDFTNAVVLAATRHTAPALLDILLDIEQQAGRVRTFANAPRTLDLDLIDYGHAVIDTPSLTLPHPRAHGRGFVMVPLAEIAPDFMVGTHGSAAQLADQLKTEAPDMRVCRQNNLQNPPPIPTMPHP